MKKNIQSFKEDKLNEGKDELYLDVDRIINEGLSGGSVHSRDGYINIEPTVELPEETPPNH